MKCNNGLRKTPLRRREKAITGARLWNAHNNSDKQKKIKKIRKIRFCSDMLNRIDKLK